MIEDFNTPFGDPTIKIHTVSEVHSMLKILECDSMVIKFGIKKRSNVKRIIRIFEDTKFTDAEVKEFIKSDYDAFVYKDELLPTYNDSLVSKYRPAYDETKFAIKLGRRSHNSY